MIHDDIISEYLFDKSRASDINRFLDPSFPNQNKFLLDTNRFITAQCSRRAGKSNGLAIRFLKAMETHPGSLCVYVALTRESARNIMWPAMQEQDAKFKIGCEFTESNLTVTHPNGARLQLFGADMKNFIRRLKGIKTPAVGIDEAQDFGGHLESLIDDVLTPAMTDYSDSWLAVTGTPGPVPKGYFFDITASNLNGFSKHSWTLLDNPYLPNAKSFLEEIKKKRGWDESNPTLRREWYNEWVTDLESLLIKYNAEKNHYEQMVPGNYTYLLGVDIGFNDSDALSLLGWGDHTPNVYLVDEKVTSKQGISELVQQIESFRKTYEISKIVMDTGGLGKKIAEELIRRFQIPIVAADKARKMENAALLDDWLRLGKFKAKRTSHFAQESYNTQIDWDKSTPDKVVLRNHCPDIIDATLYAFKESPAYTFQDPIVKPKYGTEEWAKKEVDDMEQSLIDRLMAEEDAAKGFEDYI